MEVSTPVEPRTKEPFAMDDQSSVSTSTSQSTFDATAHRDPFIEQTTSQSPNSVRVNDSPSVDRNLSGFRPSGSSSTQYDAGMRQEPPNLTSPPRNNDRGRQSPSPVPSAEARARWAMLASLAGVQTKAAPEKEPDLDVPKNEGKLFPSINHRNDQRRRSNSHNPHEPSQAGPMPVGPHIPVRGRSSAPGDRKSSSTRNSGAFDHSELGNDPGGAASIERYLQSLKMDPHVDDRGLREGLQTLMLGPNDNTMGGEDQRRTPDKLERGGRAPEANLAKDGRTAEEELRAGGNDIRRHAEDLQQDIQGAYRTAVGDVKAESHTLGSQSLGSDLQRGEHDLEKSLKNAAKIAERKLPGRDVRQEIQGGEREMKEHLAGDIHSIEKKKPLLNLQRDARAGAHDLLKDLHEGIEKEEKEVGKFESHGLGMELGKDGRSAEKSLENLGRTAIDHLENDGREVAGKAQVADQALGLEAKRAERLAEEGIRKAEGAATQGAQTAQRPALTGLGQPRIQDHGQTGDRTVMPNVPPSIIGVGNATTSKYSAPGLPPQHQGPGDPRAIPGNEYAQNHEANVVVPRPHPAKEFAPPGQSRPSTNSQQSNVSPSPAAARTAIQAANQNLLDSSAAHPPSIPAQRLSPSINGEDRVGKGQAPRQGNQSGHPQSFPPHAQAQLSPSHASTSSQQPQITPPHEPARPGPINASPNPQQPQGLPSHKLAQPGQNRASPTPQQPHASSFPVGYRAAGQAMNQSAPVTDPAMSNRRHAGDQRTQIPLQGTETGINQKPKPNGPNAYPSMGPVQAAGVTPSSGNQQIRNMNPRNRPGSATSTAQHQIGGIGTNQRPQSDPSRGFYRPVSNNIVPEQTMPSNLRTPNVAPQGTQETPTQRGSSGREDIQRPQTSYAQANQNMSQTMPVNTSGSAQGFKTPSAGPQSTEQHHQTKAGNEGGPAMRQDGRKQEQSEPKAPTPSMPSDENQNTSQSPAMLLRSQVARERQEKSKAQQAAQRQQPVEEPSSPISYPQSMLNTFKARAQESIEASNGHPGFTDRK
ncbi:Transcription factor spt20 [Mycoblastus sanguinarius]|nr:Transcription factor spt20 [Mycoblastus sanguinarius]